MKKIFLIFILVYAYANDVQEILSMSKLLKNHNLEYQTVRKVYDPFTKKKPNIKPIIIRPVYHKKKIKPIIKKTYHLEVVFLDKVRINSQWYKNYDRIDDYTVIIKNNGVFLVNKKKTIHLQNKNSLLKVSQ